MIKIDPNETLRLIRERIRALGNGPMLDDTTLELIEYVEELDRWMVSGGFPPAVWQDAFNKRTPAPISDSPWVNPNTPVHIPPF